MQRSPAFSAPGTSFVEDSFSTDGGWGMVQVVTRAMVQAVNQRWGAADEASLTCPRLTSCCAAQFLTGRGWVPVCGLGVGDPWSNV